MKRMIELSENDYKALKEDGVQNHIALANTVIANSTPISTTLSQIKEEIESTYYSQGAGFDDFPHGYIYAKDEDMKILDSYIKRAKS